MGFKLKRLEKDTFKFIRSISQISKNPLILWSTGKDSTVLLYLFRKIFGCIPYSALHIDTGKKFKEIYIFREYLKLAWRINLIIAKNEKVQMISPQIVSHFKCCTELKTNVLKNIIKRYNFDCIILSIRHDEHYVRGMEDLISLRDEKGNWQYTARFGGFGLKAPQDNTLAHIRCHPLLPWKEIDIWEYIAQENIPVNSLYFSRNGLRYRSIGCECCTKPIKSNAFTIKEIIREIRNTSDLERAGRIQDKETEDTMLRLRALGYM